MTALHERLLPCPFCGHDVTDDEGCFPLNHARSRWEVRCGNPSCFAHEPADETREAAIARWNRRATALQSSGGEVVCYGLRRKGSAAIVGIVPNKVAAKPATLEYFNENYEEVPLYLASPAQPSGFVLVPVEPTRRMTGAGQAEANKWPAVGLGISELGVIACWEAMLTAAQSAPIEQEG